MSLRLGDIAPDFEQDSSEGRIRLHEWLGDSWGVLFSHPADFTPVCTTELGFTAKLKDQFAQRGVKVLALSVDPVESHLKWIDDINETQDTRVNFPIIADADRKVSELYDLIHPNANDTLTVRSLFIIDPNKKVRLIITYPASTGRNFNEILRVIDSLQLTDEHKVATPANWEDGDEVVIVPSLKDEEEIKRRFPKGYRAVKPYLRLTPQPNPLRPDSSRLHGQARQAGPLFDGACRHATLFSHEQGFWPVSTGPLYVRQRVAATLFIRHPFPKPALTCPPDGEKARSSTSFQEQTHDRRSPSLPGLAGPARRSCRVSRGRGRRPR